MVATLLPAHHLLPPAPEALEAVLVIVSWVAWDLSHFVNQGGGGRHLFPWQKFL